MKIDFGKNDEPIKLDEMIRLLKNHETVTFKINGLGETTIDTILFKDAVEELERISEIGRETEKAFHNKTFYTKENGKLKTGIIIVTVTDLLDWAKED